MDIEPVKSNEMMNNSVKAEVNLRNTLYPGEEAPKRGIQLGLDTQGRRYPKCTSRIPVALQKWTRLTSISAQSNEPKRQHNEMSITINN